MDRVLRTLGGRYELAEVIGRGGMGTVYRATDLTLRRVVAIKVLPAALADQDPSHVARFEREARAAAALSNPGVVAVYDTGVDEQVRYIVMEYVDGRSLDAILREHGRLPVEEAIRVGTGVADALSAAHAVGIVHRDIKPGNVMIATNGAVKVLDFGIAQSGDGTAITRTSTVVGTAAYMAPEQAAGHPADGRSDIYSLGCVLYATLAGRPPFTGEAVAAILHQHASVEPPPLDRNVPPWLAALVLQMLAKRPADRPQTAAEVRDRLTRGPAGVSEPTAMTARLAPLAELTAATARLDRRPARGRRRWPAILALLAVALIVLIVLLSDAGSGHRPTATATHRPRRARHRRPHPRTVTTTTHASSTTTTPTTGSSSTTTTTTSSPPALTVAGAAGALTALVTQDSQAGSIDQPAAQQITGALGDILHSYESGNTADAQHKLGDLIQQVSMLQTHGDITSTAAGPLDQAISRFGTALASAPASTQTQPGGPPGPPPGHGGQPPGQAKKHGDNGD
jgi:serine/threonine-protein kinase